MRGEREKDGGATSEERSGERESVRLLTPPHFSLLLFFFCAAASRATFRLPKQTTMRRATATLLTRLHAGAHWAGAFVASAAPAPSTAAAAACASPSRCASSAAAGPLSGVCVLERLPVSCDGPRMHEGRRGGQRDAAGAMATDRHTSVRALAQPFHHPSIPLALSPSRSSPRPSPPGRRTTRPGRRACTKGGPRPSPMS